MILYQHIIAAKQVAVLVDVLYSYPLLAYYKHANIIVVSLYYLPYFDEHACQIAVVFLWLIHSRVSLSRHRNIFVAVHRMINGGK